MKFRYAERPGVYCRVIETGYVAVNDPVALIPYQGPAVSGLELFRCFYKKQLTEEVVARHGAPLTPMYGDGG
jgi:MOSC domain-containing protein YiiM